MSAQRLARVSEMNEENSENESDKTKNLLEIPSEKLRPRNSGQLHVTINTKPEEMEHCDGNIGNGSPNRRPSILVQEILSSRRPSAIMAAIRSPKQFVNRYRRE